MGGGCRPIPGICDLRLCRRSRPLGRAGRTLLQVPVGPWLGVCRHWKEDRRIGAHTPPLLSLAGLGWQVRRGSHGLLGPNSPRPFLFSSSRERVPLPALRNCCPCFSSHRGSILETLGPEKPLPACSVTDYQFSSPLSKEMVPTALSCLASWNLVFYFSVDICPPSFLPECRALGSFSEPNLDLRGSSWQLLCGLG